MNWYCEKCKKIHMSGEMCPEIGRQLRKNPQLLVDSANFTTVAGEYSLISSQALGEIASTVNRITGITNFQFEGTEQLARDIQVFKRLNMEPFARSGVFSTPQKAEIYYNAVKKIGKESPRAVSAFQSKLTGYSQEVDWLRFKQGQLSNLFQKSSLLNNNAPGVDGETVSRFTRRTISRTTIKASENPITQSSTAISDVREAISKGTAAKDDIIFGPKGTATAAKQAGLKNPVIEKNNVQQIKRSDIRLEQKIEAGQATTRVTTQQMARELGQGAIIGAAVEVTISSIISYVRFHNGEISMKEAFSDVSEATIHGAIVGAGIADVSVFLPGGPLGFVLGVGVGLYFSTTCTNVLDEIYGKGGYGAVLNASGYIYGMTCNLKDCVLQVKKNEIKAKSNLERAQSKQNDVDEAFARFERAKKG